MEKVNRRKSEGTLWKLLTQAGVVTRPSALGHIQGIRDINNFAYTVDCAQRNYLWSRGIRFEQVVPHFAINQTGFLRKEQNRGWQRIYMRTSYSAHWGTRRIFSGISTRLSQSLYTQNYFTTWRERNPELSLLPEFDEDLLEWRVMADVGIAFREAPLDDIQAYYQRSREVELTEGFTANGYGIAIDTNPTKPIAVGVDFSDYFNFTRQQSGKQRSLTLESILCPRSNFSIELDSGYAQNLDLENSIYGRCFASSLRDTYLFTRESFLRVFAQASSERPISAEIRENYLLSLLFGWEYSPKSPLFVA